MKLTRIVSFVCKNKEESKRALETFEVIKSILGAEVTELPQKTKIVSCIRNPGPTNGFPIGD